MLYEHIWHNKGIWRRRGMNIKRSIEKFASMTGFVFIPDWRASTLDGERHLKRLLSYLDVDCVFDVGANTGGFARMLRDRCNYRGLIISFEPNPPVFEQLSLAARSDALWHVESLALGAQTGSARFHAYSFSELGSLRSLKSSPYAPKKSDEKSVEVPVERLDIYLKHARERWGFQRPFLKMDTQGFDLEVAKGAGASLGEFVGLQSEVAFQTIYENAPDYRMAIDTYESAGFQLSRLVPIHEIHFPALVEMDAIMVRSDLIKTK